MKQRSFHDLEGLVGVDEPFEAEIAPLNGGPSVGEARAALERFGRVRFRPLIPGRLVATVEPGAPVERVLALNMIVRSDARGLARTILSAIDEVDEIVVGVDARSDAETIRVAGALADDAYLFGAQDVGLSDAEWTSDRIHFANARNFGRQRVKSDWTLFLDSDEYIEESEPIREKLRDLDPEVAAFELIVRLTGLDHHDPQRLARTRFRFRNATHNVLVCNGEIRTVDTVVVHDTSLKTEIERARRNAQRDAGMDAMLPEAQKGDLVMLYHLAKHRIAQGNKEGLTLAEDYRKRTEIHGPYADERRWLAVSAAGMLLNAGEYLEAEMWAVRALFDGPNIEAMCLLGNIAVLQDDPRRALAWYEAACALPDTIGICRAHELVDPRFKRRDELRRMFEIDEADQPQPAAS